MGPKRKEFLKPSKPKGKVKAPEPQTENDFLEAADEHEQAAGKWRAGDAAKATRFFNRAIDTYNEGLKKHPQSFDLAYNKANLEYSLTEDERILPHLGSRMALLEETLNSHRHATSLNPTNTDILFNTAQVLTSLAEAGLEDGTQEAAKTPARQLLEEAVDIFTGCLQKQQQEYEQMQAEIAKAQASGEYQEAWEGNRSQPAEAKEHDNTDTDSASEGPGDWATVEEPVTPTTILETCTAQLGALITLLGLYTPEDLPSIEKKAQDGLLTASEIIPGLINIIDASPESDDEDEPEAGPTLSIGQSAATEEASTSPKEDAVLAAANFQVSIAEAMYRSGRSSSAQYAQQVEQTFSTLIKEAQRTTAPGLAYINVGSSYADALIDLASSIADSLQYTESSPTFTSDLEIQWTALSQAQKTLTELSSAPLSSLLHASRLADIFMARGDTDLFRFRIATTPGAKAAWANSRAVVVANAGVFYRGARSYAQNASAAQTRATADAKAIVAEILKEVSSGSSSRKDTWKGRNSDVAAVLGQMVEEGIVAEENAQGLLDFTTVEQTNALFKTLSRRSKPAPHPFLLSLLNMTDSHKHSDPRKKPEARLAGASDTRKDAFVNLLRDDSSDEDPDHRSDKPGNETVSFMQALRETGSKVKRLSVDLFNKGIKDSDGSNKGDAENGGSKTI
ncbi:hypothetical protein E8E13_004380 [Curvularia kusanoi]|uniref:Uncharacterized protein n=1 Tax=Curvularia kusanoi TaxID=90978 RepID=A0A9P4WCU8_CURKU|nr:hypothetical protein E8E13_004380 [Curvularia kusanoi]